MRMVIIYVDEREKGSGVPEKLKAMGLTVIFKMLPIGDYLIPDEIAIERKRIDDFVSSIFDGRLFNQAKKLVENYPKPVMIVEGDLNIARKITSRWSSVIGALISLSLDFNIPILYTSNTQETAELIKHIAIREHRRKEKRASVVINKKPRLAETHEWQEYIVQSLPYVGPKLARRLLNHFGSVYRIFNATVSELAKVEGLGEKRASEIVRIIRAQYKPTSEVDKVKKLTSFLEE